MDSLSLDDARALLMGENIQPLTAEEDAAFKGVADAACMADADGAGGTSYSDGKTNTEELVYASLQDAEAAAFEATLDAAFGKAASAEDDADDKADRNALHNQTAAFDNGMVGLGVDIVEIERMRNILMRNPSFASKVFSLQEQIYCDTKSTPAAHYAVRFAAKEAVVKALGTGFSHGIGVRDIEVERSKSGRPLVKLSGAAARIAEEQGILDISLSMSYTKTDAVACAMALTKSAVRATEKRKDPMKELAQQFKETRKILDDL